VTLIPLSEATRIYFGGTGRAVDLMIYGGLIVLVAVFQPAGLAGLIARLSRAGRGGPPPLAADARAGTG
jgi:branched-chain amino acid transport system permease protein